jgi:hypothetical protein
MDTSEGVTWPSVITDVAQLPVAYTQENPEGIKWPWVTSGSHVTTTKKKVREKTGHAQNLLPVRVACGQGLFRWRDHFRSKGPTRADIAQLPVAHAHDILPDRVTFGHGTSGSTTSNATLSVPIYYSSILSWSFIVLAQWNSEQSVGRHVAPHGHIILIPSQQVVALPP